MRLSVATNFDNEFLRRISSYPVEEVYGKLSRDFVGGGRASYSAEKIDVSALESHVQAAHNLGIKFNYLMNSVCLGNREWSGSGIREIRRILDYLSKIKVDSITVSIPYLAELIKKHYPDFFLKIGIYANIDSSIRARFWEDLGADMLILESFSINRNFPVLKEISKAVSCRLQLIANFSCLPRCPMQIYHMTGISHGSNSHDKGTFIDYCVFKCSSMTLENPALLIKSNWIRPEDISFYENLGFDSFKLLERGAPTETLVARVKAYSGRKSPENLLDLIQPFGFREEIKTDYKLFLNLLFEKPRLVFHLYKLLKKRGMLFPLKGTPVFLDSSKIPPDFLTAISKLPCSISSDCKDCVYCQSILKATYRIDEGYKAECMRLYKKVFSILC